MIGSVAIHAPRPLSLSRSPRRGPCGSGQVVKVGRLVLCGETQKTYTGIEQSGSIRFGMCHATGELHHFVTQSQGDPQGLPEGELLVGLQQ